MKIIRSRNSFLSFRYSYKHWNLAHALNFSHYEFLLVPFLLVPFKYCPMNVLMSLVLLKPLKFQQLLIHCLIFDLRYVNAHLIKDYIRFDDWTSFETFVSRKSFAYKFDLKQGYHHVDIFSDHQQYLGFSWVTNGERRYYYFTVLPFGLCTAPYMFTKVLRPLVYFWHEESVKTSVYLDDGAGIEKCLVRAKKSSQFVKCSLEQADFVINTEKSVWIPSLTWLGLTLNCDSNIIKVTDKRINSICNLLSSLLSEPYTSARKLAKLNGKLVSTRCYQSKNESNI